MNKLNNIGVVSIIDSFRIVINKGYSDDVSIGDIFMIYYEYSEPMIDPFTGENLGILEVPVGRGEVIAVQEKLSILKSCEYSPSTEVQSAGHLLKFPETKIIPGKLLPFNKIEVGYKAVLVK